jgi:hypothetical protein
VDNQGKEQPLLKGVAIMNIEAALGGGLAGALSLTLLHEAARRVLPSAPRLDVLGMRALAKSLRALEQPVPDHNRLHTVALVGDLLSNTVYYSLVGAGEGANARRRGVLVGLAAGIGAVVLPGPLGLGRGPSRRTVATQMMTIGWYLAGGLVAGMVAEKLSNPSHRYPAETRHG